MGSTPGNQEPVASLATGQIFFYRAGSYRPEIVAPAGDAVSLPTGVWHFVAEADGWVSVASGRLEIPVGAPPDEKMLLWPVVPACRLELGSVAAWQGVERVDALSLDRSTVHPVAPLDRLELNVPAGRYLVMVYGGRGLDALSATGRCTAEETVLLERPTPPTDGVDLLVHARWPDGIEPGDASVDRGGRLSVGDSLVFGVHERSGGRLVQLAEAHVNVGSRSTFVLRGLPTDQDLELRWAHPALRSGRRELSNSAAGAHELEEISWRARVAAEVPVDYVPIAEHRQARLWIIRCGERPPMDLLEVRFSECRDVTEPQPLRPGLHRYRFEGLNLGWHVIMAEVDGEVIPGLGDMVAVQVTEASPGEVELEPVALEEMRIDGRILIDGVAIAGEVRLAPYATLPGPPRIFPTGNDLRYDMNFFAETPTRFHRARLPAELQDRGDAELRGLFVRYQVLVCSEGSMDESPPLAGNGCHAIHPRSTFSGGGTLDFELSGRSLRVELVDDATGAPLDGRVTEAGVVARPVDAVPYDTLHFFHGEVLHREAESVEGAPVSADAEGVVRLHGVAKGEILVVAAADGYERAEVTLTEDATEARLRLRRDIEAGPPPVILQLPDGNPAAGAFLVVVGALGSLPQCHQRSDSEGRVRWPGTCETQGLRRALVFHSRVPVQAVRLVFLPADRRLRLAADPARQVELRTLDLAGLPAPWEPVDWRVDGILLDADTALRSLSKARGPLPFRSDAEGRLTLSVLAGSEVQARPRGAESWQTWGPSEALELIVP